MYNEQDQEILDLINQAHDIIQSVDMEGNFVYVNNRWHAVLGFSPSEVDALNVFDVIRIDHRQKCRQILETLAESRTATNIETVFVAKDGREVPVQGNLSLRLEAGRPVATRGIFRDVSEQVAVRKQLQDQLTRSQTILNHAPLGILLYDALGSCVEANSQAATIVGAPVEDLLRQNFRRIRSWKDSGILAKAEAALVSRGTANHEAWLTTSFGKRVCLKCRFIYLELAERPHLLAILEDVTLQREAEIVQLSYQSRLQHVSQITLDIARCSRREEVLQKSIDVAVGLVAADYGALVCLDRKTGAPTEIFSSQYPLEAIPPETKISGRGVLAEIVLGRSIFSADITTDRSFGGFPSWHPPIKAMIGLPVCERDKVVALLVVGRGMDGESFEEEDLSLLQTLANLVAVADQTARQMEELSRLNKQLEVFARTDELTGVGNRRSFEEEVARFASGSSRYRWPFGVLMVDVDNFKAYNDTYGHQAGDRVLAKIAEVLASSIRADDRLFRYGGEEFVLLLPHQKEGGIIAAAERLRALVESLAIPHKSGVAGIVTISLGGAIFNPQDELQRSSGWEGCLKAADQALYRAKETGRNRSVVASGREQEEPRTPSSAKTSA